MSNIKSSNEVISISLDDAYEIIGGYKAADEKTVAIAMEMLEKESLTSDFALQLLTLYKSKMSLKDIDFNNISDVQLEKGLDKAIEFSRSEDDYIRQIFSDNTNNSLIINTKLIDTNGDEASVQAADNGALLLARTATEEIKRKLITGQLNSIEDAQNALNSQFASKYFDLRSAALKDVSGAYIEDASDAKKTVHILAKDISEKFENDKQAIKELDKELEKRTEKSKSTGLKAKWRKFKTLIVAGFMTISGASFMSSCSNDSKQDRKPTQQEVVNTPLNMKKTKVQPKTISLKQDTVKEVAVVMPTEYSDSLGVSRTSWLSTQKFDDNSFTRQVDDSTTIRGSEFAYQRLAIAKDSLGGRTIEQGLNAHRYLRSMYPNPENLDGKGIDPATLEAAKIAKELDCFLKGETNVIPEGLDKIFVEQVPGNLNIYATGINNPCDDGKVQYKTLQSKVQKDITWEEAVDSAKVKGPTIINGETEVDVKADTTKVLDNVRTDKYNGNEKYGNGKLIKENVSVNEVNRKVTSNPEVLVEQTTKAEKTDTITDAVAQAVVLEASSKVSAQQNDTVSVKKKAANLRKEQAKKEARAQKTALSDSITAPAAPIIVEGETEVVTDNAQATAPIIVEGETEVVTPADTVQVKKEQAEVKLTTTEVSNEAQGTGGTEEIILGTENVPLGTPSAFDTPERGGFEGSGITKKADEHNRKILGDELYDLIVNGSPDKWFNNGDIAEGLSRRQWASVVAVMVATGPHQATTQEILDAINCQREIRAELFDKVKADVDGIRENRTRDGWTYDKPVYVRKIKNNGCEKKVTLDKIRTENRKKTTASGPKFPRFFKLIKTIVPIMGAAEVDVVDNTRTVTEPLDVKKLNGNEKYGKGKVIEDNVSVKEAFREVATDPLVLVEVSSSDTTKVVAQELNGNENFTNGKKIKTVDVAQLLGIKVSGNTKVLVQTDKKPSSLRKQIAKLNDRYVKAAKANGLTGNVALDKYSEAGSEFISKFQKDNDITPEYINAISVYQQSKDNKVQANNRGNYINSQNLRG